MVNKNILSNEILKVIFEGGLLNRKNEIDFQIKDIKITIKERLKHKEEKRFELFDGNVIAKWIRKEKNEISQIEMNDFLNDIGVFIPCVIIPKKGIPKDKLSLLEPFIKNREEVIDIKQKEKIVNCTKYLEHQHILSTEKLARSFYSLKTELNLIEQELNSLKQFLIQCPELREEKKISCEHGTVSLKTKVIDYDVESIANTYGTDFLINNGKIDNDILNYFMIKQILNKSDIDKYKKLVDINLNFVLMKKEDEDRQYAYFNNRINFIR